MTHIRHLARQLRQQYGTRDPFLLCEQMDIAVLYTDLPLITKGIFFSISGRRVINLSLSLAEQEKTAVCAMNLDMLCCTPQTIILFYPPIPI